MTQEDVCIVLSLVDITPRLPRCTPYRSCSCAKSFPELVSSHIDAAEHWFWVFSYGAVSCFRRARTLYHRLDFKVRHRLRYRFFSNVKIGSPWRCCRFLLGFLRLLASSKYRSVVVSHRFCHHDCGLESILKLSRVCRQLDYVWLRDGLLTTVGILNEAADSFIVNVPVDCLYFDRLQVSLSHFSIDIGAQDW